MTLVSIIIPTYNDQACIERTVLSMQEQAWDDLEILVINDGSTDATPQILERLAETVPNLRLFHVPGKSGAATARNVGFQNARGTILALIDGDMWAPPEWVPTLIAPLLTGEAEVTGGPDRVPPDSPLISRCIGYSMDSLLTNAGLRLGDSKLVRYLPGTGNMAITRAALDKAGNFDESFHDTGEDKEWLHRVSESGARCVYLPQALAWHERRPDLLLHARKQLLSGRRRFDIVLQDRTAFEIPHFLPAFILLFLALAPWWAPLRPLWSLVVGVCIILISIDCIRGARQMGDWRAFPILWLSSVCIPVGYGLGVIIRAGERLLGSRPS